MTLIRSGYLMKCVHIGSGAMNAQGLLPIEMAEDVHQPLMVLPESAKKFPKMRGHAALSGTGPLGETCGSCGSYRSVQGGTRSYPKCELAKARWTRGPGSDIRKSDPACERWSATAKEMKS